MLLRTCVHTYVALPHREKSAKLKEKPSQAFLLRILIHFSTQLASKYLLYFSPAAPPLAVSPPPHPLEKAANIWINADTGGISAR